MSYFDDANLVPYIRSRAIIAAGLLDNHTPPHAAINAFAQINGKVREKQLLVNPWVGHNGWPELNPIIPRWMAEDAGKASK